ncbi:COG1361 S-layer family protein [Natronoarchaeum rubrum]|uniref:COG1361 S-layer family protein n=1 Tax=Natronoarchaeum rubrum TaxID=755311 RepID=UPI002112ADCA|nr:hypothetical protein [Natronoarchaeum rubrum]
MTDRLPGPRRRSIVAGLLLVAAVVWVGAGAAAALPSDAPNAALQDGTPNNESATNDTTAGATTDQQDGTPPQNDSDAQPGTDAGAPAADDSTTAGPPPIAEPDENVTVAVVENQSVPAGASTTLSLEVENDGDGRVRDLVVTLQTPGDALILGSLDAPQATRSVYVEELQPGRTETVDLDVGAAAVEPGTYPLFASVQYAVDVDDDDDDGIGNDTDDDDDGDDGDNDDETEIVGPSGPAVLGVPVTDAVSFDVTPVESEIPVDGSGVYSVRITNEGNETATGVVATLATGPPLTSESPTAYVGTLEPDASATVRFALESSSDAIETTASASIAVGWETDAGDRASADPVSVPVDVADADDETDVDSVAPFVAVALVLAIATVWWFRRR